MIRTNMRIYNSELHETYAEYYCDPADEARIKYIKKELIEVCAEEPSLPWQLETRGEDSIAWHVWGIDQLT